MLADKPDVLISYFEDSKVEVKKLIEGLSTEQLDRRPADGGWSISECIEHLVVAGREYSILISEKLEQVIKQNDRSEDPYKLSLIGKMFSKSLEPPVKRKYKTPVVWQPVKQKDHNELINSYFALQDYFIKVLERSKGYNISKYKIISPASKLLKFRLPDAYNFIAAHQRRHVWQAQNARNEITQKL